MGEVRSCPALELKLFTRKTIIDILRFHYSFILNYNLGMFGNFLSLDISRCTFFSLENFMDLKLIYKGYKLIFI